MQALERRVICTLEKKYSFEKEEKIGRLNVLFEVLPDGNVSPVNQLEIFCETGQVFVTSGFNEIRERFNDAIFETKCKPTSFEHRDGECRYVSNSSSCEDIRGIMVAQLFKMPLPNILHPVIILSEAPQTKIIFLEDDKFIYGPFSYELNDKNIGKQHILTLASITTPINKIPPFHIAKINKEKVNNHISVNIRQGTFFLGNVKYIIENNDDIIDFISNEQIISTYGNKIAQNSNIRNFSKGTIT
ncbi:hypothetical protein QE197_16240 [Arsenophonus nasoniae]|nr:hypothetical protein [Arsenophonus nasoniae]QBY45112.1 hypothetical protein ArsFIN_37050 [Arsenophonus nasoniae]WGM05315.1 hypothetical protein QE258_17605 [Arsenophonus nasoniae]WGM10323.1 hypothetical protein QE197_16240 [Arsenophonus nasoniae]WGM15038.1 hypothetical protein QE193_16135 [Arsenophonus nasoniae]CBA76149.1 hypothetical protein ARN_33760 [Arsenophonus nasoniae]